MNEAISDLIGMCGATLTTAAFVPQVLHTLRTRSTSDVSLGMFCLLCLGICFWLVYGAATSQLPVLVANGVTLFLAGIVLGMKVANVRAGRDAASPFVLRLLGAAGQAAPSGECSEGAKGFSRLGGANRSESEAGDGRPVEHG